MTGQGDTGAPVVDVLAGALGDLAAAVRMLPGDDLRVLMVLATETRDHDRNRGKSRRAAVWSALAVLLAEAKDDRRDTLAAIAADLNPPATGGIVPD